MVRTLVRRPRSPAEAKQREAKRGGYCGFGARNTEGPGRVPQPVALPCDVSSQNFAVAKAYRSVRARKQRVSHWECSPKWCAWPYTVGGRPETLEGGNTCPPSHRGVQIPSRSGQQVAGRPPPAGLQQRCPLVGMVEESEATPTRRWRLPDGAAKEG